MITSSQQSPQATGSGYTLIQLTYAQMLRWASLHVDPVAALSLLQEHSVLDSMEDVRWVKLPITKHSTSPYQIPLQLMFGAETVIIVDQFGWGEVIKSRSNTASYQIDPTDPRAALAMVHTIHQMGIRGRKLMLESFVDSHKIYVDEA